MVTLGGLLSYYYRFSNFNLNSAYETAIILGVLLAALIFPAFRLYHSWRGRALTRHLWTVTLAWFCTGFILAFIAFSLKSGAEFSRIWAGHWLIYTWLYLIFSRIIIHLLINYFRKKGWNHKKIVIIGAGNLGQKAYQQLMAADWIGYDLVSFWDDKKAGSIEEMSINGISILSVDEGVELLLSGKTNIDEVWITLPFRAEERMRDILKLLRHSTVTVRLIPDIFSLSLLNHSMTEVAGLPVINISESPMHGLNRAVKFLEDKIIASTILILISPLMVAIAIGVKLSSPGPVFYRQERVGWNNKVFTMLKFRSMPVDSESTTGPVWANSQKNRATKYGSFLRRTSLDELPQFINVLIGNMSIVGPRPERPVFVNKFKHEIPEYMKKHMVKAGITGWAQINGWRGDSDLKKRIECDIYYIENWSLWYDMKIIFLSLIKGFLNKNAY